MASALEWQIDARMKLPFLPPMSFLQKGKQLPCPQDGHSFRQQRPRLAQGCTASERKEHHQNPDPQPQPVIVPSVVLPRVSPG